MNPLASLNWNPQWRREGKEPDYRFALANERTFLSFAWLGLFSLSLQRPRAHAIKQASHSLWNAEE